MFNDDDAADDDDAAGGGCGGGGGRCNAWTREATLEGVVAAARARAAARAPAPALVSRTKVLAGARRVYVSLPGGPDVLFGSAAHVALLALLDGATRAPPRACQWRAELEAVPREGRAFALAPIWRRAGLLWRDSRVPAGQPLGGAGGAAAARAEAALAKCRETFTLTSAGVDAAMYLREHDAALRRLHASAAASPPPPPPGSRKRATPDGAHGGGGGGGSGGGAGAVRPMARLGTRWLAPAEGRDAAFIARFTGSGFERAYAENKAAREG